MQTLGAGLRPGLALVHPDRPHNLGAALRLAACTGVSLEVVEPCGFPLDPRRIREASLDYAELARLRRHESLAAFLAWSRERAGRLVLLTTRGDLPYHGASFTAGDLLVLGSEGEGAPVELHEAAALRVRVPMIPAARSLNVVVAAAIVLGECLRQTGELDRLTGLTADSAG